MDGYRYRGSRGALATVVQRVKDRDCRDVSQVRVLYKEATRNERIEFKVLHETDWLWRTEPFIVGDETMNRTRVVWGGEGRRERGKRIEGKTKEE